MNEINWIMWLLDNLVPLVLGTFTIWYVHKRSVHTENKIGERIDKLNTKIDNVRTELIGYINEVREDIKKLTERVNNLTERVDNLTNNFGQFYAWMRGKDQQKFRPQKMDRSNPTETLRPDGEPIETPTKPTRADTKPTNKPNEKLQVADTKKPSKDKTNQGNAP